MAESSDVQRDLALLENELRKLEAEYNMFFAGRLARPPWESRNRVQQLVKRLDAASIPNYADRFRFTTLQTRLVTYDRLWERNIRVRDEGRPEDRDGELDATRQAPSDPVQTAVPAPVDETLYDTTIRDPDEESDKLHELYDRLTAARRDAGEAGVPYPQFAELVQRQIARLKEAGGDQAAFRLALKGGRVSFTVRSVGRPKDAGEGRDGEEPRRPPRA